MPKGRRRPQLPNATPTWLVEELLALAVAKPTLGCRQLADELGRRGYAISKTTVQKHLVDHGLGKRAQRLARAAAIAALVGGPITEAAASDELFGFCHFAARPGDLVATGQLLHREPQGRGQGVPAHRHRHRHPLGRHVGSASTEVGADPTAFAIPAPVCSWPPVPILLLCNGISATRT